MTCSKCGVEFVKHDSEQTNLCDECFELATCKDCGKLLEPYEEQCCEACWIAQVEEDLTQSKLRTFLPKRKEKRSE